MAHPIVHVEFSAKDPRKAMQWYSNLFGWSTQYDEEMDYGMFQGVDGGPGGGFYTSDQMSGTVVYVATDDIPALLAKVEKMGGKIVREETPIPGAGAFALFADPDGNIVGVFKGGGS